MSAQPYAGPLFEALIAKKIAAGDRGRLWPPASHAGDPDTSRQAELDHTLSGMRSSHLQIVLNAVRYQPGQTARGYAALLEMELIEVRRRLTDGKGLGLLRMGEPRAMGKHKAERTWWPA